jgi:glycosyltransferase involved in cell wall biosynthesis
VAYLANLFPAAVEAYVGEEIQQLRDRGVQVIAGSVRKTKDAPRQPGTAFSAPRVLTLQPLKWRVMGRAAVLAMRRRKRIVPLLSRVLMRGKESPWRRLKALIHLLLGAYYAAELQKYEVDHIHVHHGYFGSWIAMTAARLLEIEFSLTLHGSDLLVHGAYLDTKLENCHFCLTVSEFNRRYILQHFPEIDPEKIIVSRLGVDPPEREESPPKILCRGARHVFTLLAVGRLHAVKNHAFLIRSCDQLRRRGLDFVCAIAGEGPERGPLESLIRQKGLQDCVRLFGHVRGRQLEELYRGADVVVLTSHSEGIPVALMEAMVRGRIVLAPWITGIPELVIPGKTGFLYEPGAIEDFVARIFFLANLMRIDDRNPVSRMDWIRHGARVQVRQNFHRKNNLACFADRFLKLVSAHESGPSGWSVPNEDFVLQQI